MSVLACSSTQLVADEKGLHAPHAVVPRLGQCCLGVSR